MSVKFIVSLVPVQWRLSDHLGSLEKASRIVSLTMVRLQMAQIQAPLEEDGLKPVPCWR